MKFKRGQLVHLSPEVTVLNAWHYDAKAEARTRSTTSYFKITPEDYGIFLKMETQQFYGTVNVFLFGDHMIKLPSNLKKLIPYTP